MSVNASMQKKNKKEERKFDVLFTDLETEEEGGVS